MLKNISIISILLIVLINASNAQLISKKEFRLKESKTNSIELIKNYSFASKSFALKNNSPLLAGTLSFIVPGAALGQLYNGQFVNFGIRIGISVLSIVWLAESGFFNLASDVKGNDAWTPLLIIYAANWITSIVDAVIYNKKHLSWR